MIKICMTILAVKKISGNQPSGCYTAEPGYKGHS